MVEHLERDGARGEHVATFLAYAAPRSNFDKLLLRLLELQARHGRDGRRDGRRAAMLSALNGRASWSQIREWRRGRRWAPIWAWDLLESKIAQRHAKDGELLKNKTAGE